MNTHRDDLPLSVPPIFEYIAIGAPRWRAVLMDNHIIWNRQNAWHEAAADNNPLVRWSRDEHGYFVWSDKRTDEARRADRERYKLKVEGKHAQAKRVTGWKLSSDEDVAMEETKWLWSGFLALNELVTWNGEAGQGKSLTAIDLGARLSTGAAWPDETVNDQEPCATLYVSEEESFSRTVKPRWYAAGGKRGWLFNLEWDDNPLRIDKNLEQLSTIIQESYDLDRPIRYIIFDPIKDYTGVDALDDQKVRPVLTRLKQWAAEEEVVIVGIAHPNKKNDLTAIQRTSGAKGWVSVARINNVVGTDANGIRHLASLKTNIHKPVSHAFKIVGKQVTADGLTVTSESVEWIQGGTSATADDLMGQPKQERVRARQQAVEQASAAEKWLVSTIAGTEAKLAQEIADQLQRLFGLSQSQIARLTRQCEVIKTKTREVPSRALWRIAPFTEGLAD